LAASTQQSPFAVKLAWTASTDNVGVTGYQVWRRPAGTGSFAQIGTSATAAYTDASVVAGSSYDYEVFASDAAGNVSAVSNVATITPLDTTAPSMPGTLTATAASATQVNLGWGASSDNVGVSGYQVWRRVSGAPSFSQLGTSTGTAYSDNSAVAATSYEYQVVAFDAAGNTSPVSNTATATTPVTAVVFSEGFETGDLSRWNFSTGLTVQSQEFFAGAFAARGTTTIGTTYAYTLLPGTYGDATLTAQVKIVSQTGNVNLMKFRTGAGNGSGVSLAGLFVTSSGNLSLRNDVSATTTTSTIAVTPGVWHELKLHEVVGGPTGSLQEVWLDGVKVDALTRTDSLGTTPIGRAAFGDWTAARTYDVVWDEIKVTA
jgi:chitodextrinase